MFSGLVSAHRRLAGPLQPRLVGRAGGDGRRPRASSSGTTGIAAAWCPSRRRWRCSRHRRSCTTEHQSTPPSPDLAGLVSGRLGIGAVAAAGPTPLRCAAAIGAAVPDPARDPVHPAAAAAGRLGDPGHARQPPRTAARPCRSATGGSAASARGRHRRGRGGAGAGSCSGASRPGIHHRRGRSGDAARRGRSRCGARPSSASSGTGSPRTSRSGPEPAVEVAGQRIEVLATHAQRSVAAGPVPGRSRASPGPAARCRCSSATPPGRRSRRRCRAGAGPASRSRPSGGSAIGSAGELGRPFPRAARHRSGHPSGRAPLHRRDERRRRRCRCRGHRTVTGSRDAIAVPSHRRGWRAVARLWAFDLQRFRVADRRRGRPRAAARRPGRMASCTARRSRSTCCSAATATSEFQTLDTVLRVGTMVVTAIVIQADHPADDRAFCAPGR